MRALIFLSMAVSIAFLNAHAAEADFSAPIEIEAQQVEVNAQDGTSIYQGDVRLNRGSMKIRAEKIILKQTEHEVSADIQGITGKPAEFSQRGDSGEPMNAKAQRIKYFSHRDTIEFEGGAEIQRAADTVKSDHIRYDLRAEQILAGVIDDKGKPKTDGNRVRIVIQPPADNTETP